jgi:hypothetical protein
MATSTLVAEMPYIDDVMPLNENDDAVIAELKQVLLKHGAETRFGITLLHDHFPIEEDEVMAEFEDATNRQLLTRPIKATELQNRSFIETQWRLDTDTSMLICMKNCISVGGGHTGSSNHVDR